MEEIKFAIDQIGALKAPGPDDMPAIFYQHYWESVRLKLIEMVVHFFHSGHLLRHFNHIFIVLLPKCEHPSQIKQFRSVSSCNVAFKVITKIMSIHLKGVISKLISPHQAAFFPGKVVIQDNILLSQEIFHSIKAKRGRKGLMALKLDMEKAYDRME